MVGGYCDCNTSQRGGGNPRLGETKRGKEGGIEGKRDERDRQTLTERDRDKETERERETDRDRDR